ncbi:bifunctional heptose 7-phosphate kinase/heptose 1-phosphate adenyltransferase [Cohnella soli]|uniref:Bifunctional heptose 7-phosphate kinase/heptose 1-phosphate adenyltransferase n=1 Tax=Cohnella soli TaxID=425005 RepID=A0ABW0I4C9_9BACL
MDKYLELLKNDQGTGLVIGDIILDEYHNGISDYSSNERSSVFRKQSTLYFPGNAANIANGIASLNQNVILCGIIGNDFGGQKLIELLHDRVDHDSVIIEPYRDTSVKTRIESEHLKLRIDKGYDYRINEHTEAQIVSNVSSLMEILDYVLLSDWGEGTLSAKLTKAVISLAVANRIPVFVDPRGKDPEKYRGATCVTPNLDEFNDLTEFRFQSLNEAIPFLRPFIRKYDIESIILKDGHRGSVWANHESFRFCAPFSAYCECDIGAGDSLICSYAVLRSKKIPDSHAFLMSNLAAAITISKPHTYCVTLSDLMRYYDEYANKLNVDWLAEVMP